VVVEKGANYHQYGKRQQQQKILFYLHHIEGLPDSREAYHPTIQIQTIPAISGVSMRRFMLALAVAVLAIPIH
jgi:hypothetical protein